MTSTRAAAPRCRHHPTRPLADELDRHTRIYAATRRWSKKQTDEARWGIRILLGLQDTPGAAINATEVLQLRAAGLPTWTVLEVLADAGLLIDDRPPAFDTWLHTQIERLPERMTTELLTWYDVMRHGRANSPRRRPRSETTIRLHIRWALPILRAWAASGHTSLREISKEDILDALPASGSPRSTTGQGLKSVFRTLKEHRVLFTDPTGRVKTGEHDSRQPVPANLDAILNEAHATDGDVRRLVDLFGLSVQASTRYTKTIDHPDLTRHDTAE